MPYIDAVRMGHNVMAYQIDMMTSTYKAKGYLYFYVREMYSDPQKTFLKIGLSLS